MSSTVTFSLVSWAWAPQMNTSVTRQATAPDAAIVVQLLNFMMRSPVVTRSENALAVGSTAGRRGWMGREVRPATDLHESSRITKKSTRVGLIPEDRRKSVAKSYSGLVIQTSDEITARHWCPQSRRN